MTELVSLWKTNIQIVHVAIDFEMNDQQLINQKLLKKRLNDFNVMFYNIDFENNIAIRLKNLYLIQK
jgi:hypothetical protein